MMLFTSRDINKKLTAAPRLFAPGHSLAHEISIPLFAWIFIHKTGFTFFGFFSRGNLNTAWLAKTTVYITRNTGNQSNVIQYRPSRMEFNFLAFHIDMRVTVRTRRSVNNPTGSRHHHAATNSGYSGIDFGIFRCRLERHHRGRSRRRCNT